MSSDGLAAAVLAMSLILSGCAHAPRSARDLDRAAWQRYQRQFVTRDGRVVDTGQGRISHSEGQGFGLLLAEAYGDRIGFDRIWRWTREHLQVRDDRLFAWRFDPAASGDPVADRNNATDGDLLIAWALIRGARRWGDPTLLDQARAIARDLKRRVVVETDYGPILLPGAEGFVHDGVVTVNLSYWVFPALRELHKADPDPIWDHLYASGMRLVEIARFGRWGLPPDWLALTAPLAPSDRFPPRFGYEAVRIPLYLVWAGVRDEVLLGRFAAFWDHFDGAPFVPGWADLGDDSVDSHDAGDGVRAIRDLVRAALESADARVGVTGGDGGDYYARSLALLASIAAREALP